jgi:hypothetical protein
MRPLYNFRAARRFRSRGPQPSERARIERSEIGSETTYSLVYPAGPATWKPLIMCAYAFIDAIWTEGLRSFRTYLSTMAAE